MTAARAYFTSVDAGNRGSLWVSDGTAAGTHQVTTVGGFAGLGGNNYAVLNSAVYFSAFDSAGRDNLFRLDPATNGVAELAVSGASSAGLSPSGTATINGKLFFAGKDAVNAPNLWVSDGTAAGTSEVVPLGSGGSYFPGRLAPLGGKVAFSGEAVALSDGLYLTDGTAAGTAKVPVAGAAPSGPGINTLASLGTTLVFGGVDASYKYALWASDGTAAGTSKLSVPGLNPTGGYTGRVEGLLAFGTKAAFTAVDAGGKNGIWVTDGTASGTVELPGVYGNAYGSSLAALSGNRLAFIGTDAGGKAGVYVTDGTAAGTARVAVPGAAVSGLAPQALIGMGNRFLFDGVSSAGTRSLFSSDGTAAGTTLVKAGAGLLFGNLDTDAAVLGGSVGTTDTATGASATVLSDIYTGPVGYLQQQYIWPGSHGVAMRADAPNTFLKGGIGDDALAVTGGNNILDGGAGSNFLTGGTGADGGADTFFVDERGAAVTWSTFVNFHQGDTATMFGFHPGLSTLPFTDDDGVDGYRGITLHSEVNGAGTGVQGSLTFAGISGATMNAHFTFTFGTLGAGTATPTDFMQIQWDH